MIFKLGEIYLITHPKLCFTSKKKSAIKMIIEFFFIIFVICLMIFLAKCCCIKKPAIRHNHEAAHGNTCRKKHYVFIPHVRNTPDVNNKTSYHDSISHDETFLKTNLCYRSLLHAAAEEGDIKTIKTLLQSGADVNAQDNWGRTALHYSIKRNDFDAIKLLLNSKADANLKDNRGDTVLMEALRCKRSFEVVKLLLNHGSEVNSISSWDSSTPLHEACNPGGNFETVELLLKNGAGVNARGTWGKTALHYAVMSANEEVVRLLLDYKADVNAKDINGEIALFEASRFHQRIKVVQLLVDYGSDVNSVRMKDGLTVLHEACRIYDKNIKVIKFLLEKGADANALDLKSHSPLMYIYSHVGKRLGEEDYEEKLRFLLEYTDVNVGASRECHILNCDENQLYWKIVVEHIAKLRALKLHVDPSILEFISCRREYRNYFRDCEIELLAAKAQKLKNSWLTFFDLLADDRKKLKNYTGNQDLMNDVGNICFWRIFPIYGEQMEKNVKKGILRRELFDKTSIKLSEYLPIFNPNHLIVRDILDCILGTKDLSKLYKNDCK